MLKCQILPKSESSVEIRIHVNYGFWQLWMFSFYHIDHIICNCIKFLYIDYILTISFDKLLTDLLVFTDGSQPSATNYETSKIYGLERSLQIVNSDAIRTYTMVDKITKDLDIQIDTIKTYIKTYIDIQDR